MVMTGRSVHLNTLLLGKLEQAVNQYFVHILSLVTDNNPSCIYIYDSVEVRRMTGVSLITAGSLDMGVFNGFYHIITWNRHFIINDSEYLHLFLLVLY